MTIQPILEVIKKVYDEYTKRKDAKKRAIIEDRIKGQEEQVDEFNAFQRWMIRFGKRN